MAYSTINKPSDYFNTVTYTGNGSTQTITGVGFQPDLVWLKNRSNALWWHILVDAVRGAGNTLSSNVTNTEFDTGINLVPDFDPDGFDLNVNPNDTANEDTSSYVAWNWLADNTSGSSNTDGSITSTVSANTTSGFSIVSFTGNSTAGATVGHGLGTVPSMIILKSRNSTDLWFVQHTSLGATKFLRLNDTDASTTQTNVWNDTEPTSSVFSLGDGSGTNGSSNNFIAYCFAEKKGFSKFGSYTGNGSTDGTFVYTGFKPAMVILKRTDSADSWMILDSVRNTSNVVDKRLQPDLINGEATTTTLDFTSNGFKLRSLSGQVNGSGGSYIYMAFAERSLVGTNGVPALAR